MNEELQLTRLLRGATPPVADEARERTVVAARAAVGLFGPKRLTRPRLAAAFAVLAALVAFSFTPPGRAVAEAIGELVGIGDEPSGSAGFGQPGVVIGVGESPDGFPFEVIAARSDHEPAAEQETCVGLDLPGLSGSRSASCVTETQLRFLEKNAVAPTVYAAPNELGPEAQLLVQGLVRPDAEEVEVTFVDAAGRRRKAPVQFVSLDETLGKEIGANERVDFFASFLPQGVLAGEPGSPDLLTPDSIVSSLSRVEVVVRGDEGQLLASGELPKLTPSLRLLQTGPLMINPPDGFENGAPRLEEP